MRIKDRSTVYAYSISVCMGSFVFGYQLTSFSSLFPLMAIANDYEQSPDSHQHELLVSSVLALAAIFGVSLHRLLIKSFGYIYSFKITDYLTIVGAFIGVLNLSLGTQVLSRIILGLVAGLNTISIPTYLTSVLPGSMGGPAGTLNQLFITIGIFFGFWMGFIVVDSTTSELGWRLIIALPIIPAVIRLHTAQNVYPYELIETIIENEDDEQLQSYLDLMYEEVTLEQFKHMKQLPVEDIQAEQATFFDPAGESYRRRVLMALGIVFFNQLSGLGALGSFGGTTAFSTIFGDSPSSILKAFTYLNLLQIIVTLFAGQFLEKYGRRAFMMEGQRIIIISLLLIGFIEVFVPELHVFTGILTYIHMVGFSLSYGPCSFLIGTEILHDIYYPSTLLWVFIFVMGLVTGPFIEALGVGVICFIYFLIELFGFLYISGYLIETQGRSRQDVYADFRHRIFPGANWLREKRQAKKTEIEMSLVDKPEHGAGY